MTIAGRLTEKFRRSARVAFVSGLLALSGCQIVQSSLSMTGDVIAEPPSENLPNIIIILADDLGYGDLSSYGSQTIRTPNIDELVDDGIKLTDFYADPTCSPSRAALLTGRYAIRSGITSIFTSDSWTGLPEDEITIAEILKENGYATSIVGKWHLGHRDKFLPTRHGFDEYYGIPFSNDMRGAVILRDETVVDFEPDQQFLTQNYTQEALSFIERNADAPFFLYLSHAMPHTPVYRSPDFAGVSRGGLYGDAVEELDWSVGEIRRKLGELGLTDNTLIMFLSDNGPATHYAERGGSAGALRGGKTMTFEGGVRVPAIMAWPGKIPSGSVSDAIMSLMDVLPTVTSFVDTEISQDLALDGEDMSATLLGQQADQPERRYAYFHLGKIRAFRMGNWKIKLPHPDHRTQYLRPWLNGGHKAHGLLLFNLNDDPGETTNLAESNPDKVIELKMALTDFENSFGNVRPALQARALAHNPDASWRNALIKERDKLQD